MSRTLTWTDAVDLRQFGECMALWLEGRIPDMPTASYSAGISPETRLLVPLLARLNRSGKFITTASQPACTPHYRSRGGTMPWQRAAVMAFVPEAARRDVWRTLRDLAGVVRMTEPGTPSCEADVLVSRRGDETDVTWFGNIMSPADIALSYGGVPGNSSCPGLAPSLIRELQGCYQITAVVRQWGSNEPLWSALRPLAG